MVDTDAPESTRNVHLCPPTYASTVGSPRPSSVLARSFSGHPYCCKANMALPAAGKVLKPVFCCCCCDGNLYWAVSEWYLGQSLIQCPIWLQCMHGNSCIALSLPGLPLPDPPPPPLYG